MTVKPSGSPLSFTDIYTEFGLPPGKNLGAYRLDGGITISGLESLALDNDTNSSGIITPLMPRSGTIKFSDFYGKKLNVVIDCTVNQGSYQITNAASDTNSKATVSFITSQSTPSPLVSNQWITVSGMVPSIFNGDFLIESTTSTPFQGTQITNTYTSDTTVTLPSDAKNISITVAGAKGGTGGNDSGGTGGNGGSGTVGTFTLPNGGRTLQFKIGGVGGNGGNSGLGNVGGTPGTSNVSAGGRGGNAGGHGSSGTGGGGGGATGVYDSVTSSYIIVAGGGAGGGGGSWNRNATDGQSGSSWSSSSGSFSIAVGKQGQDKGPSPADGGGGGGGGGGAIGGNGGNAGTDNSSGGSGGTGGESKYNSNFATITNTGTPNSGNGYVTITYTTSVYKETVTYTIPKVSATTATQLGTVTGGPLGKTNAKSKYINKSDDLNVISLGFQFKDSEKDTKVWIHTNAEVGSSKRASEIGGTKNYYCSLLTGTWDPTVNLRVDIGPNGKVYGAGGDGGSGGSGQSGSQQNGTNGQDGTSAIGINPTESTKINIRGKIQSGGGGGGGGGAAWTHNRIQKLGGVEWQDAYGYPGGGGGGIGYPAGAGGKGDGGNGSAGKSASSGNGGDGTSGSTNIGSVGGGGGGGAGTDGSGGNGGYNGNGGGGGNTTLGGKGGDGTFSGGGNGHNEGTGGSGGSGGYAIIISNDGTGVSIITTGTASGNTVYNRVPV